MAYLATTATSATGFLNELGNFALSVGWTVEWNLTDELGIRKGPVYAAFGVRYKNQPRNMQITGGTINDALILSTLASSFNLANKRVLGGHPGAPGGTSTSSSDHVYSNDWNGPFTNVFFFSNATGDYIHAIAQTGSRYSMLSFGLLDNAGLSTNPSGYMMGTYHTFWEDFTSPTSSNYHTNRPGGTGSWSPASSSAIANYGHSYIFYGRGSVGSVSTDSNSQVLIGAGVIDPTLLPALASTTVLSGYRALVDIYNVPERTNLSWPRLHQAQLYNALPTSIGLPLVDFPIIIPRQMANSVFVGIGPDVRMVWMETLAPGQEIDVNGDIWKCFPIKQKGTLAAVAVEPGPNSWNYGLAFRKTL